MYKNYTIKPNNIHPYAPINPYSVGERKQHDLDLRVHVSDRSCESFHHLYRVTVV